MRKKTVIISFLAILGFLLVGILGFWVVPAAAGPPTLSDTEMDDFFAQGIVIQNTFSDDDTFANAQTQDTYNSGTNGQMNDAMLDPDNTGAAMGGDASNANATADSGDTGSIALGGADGGDATTTSNSQAWGGDAVDSDTDSFDINSYTAGSGTATDGDDSSDGGTGAAIPVALASGGEADADADNDGGNAGNLGLAAALGLGLNVGWNDYDTDSRAMSTQANLNFVYQSIDLNDFAMASDYSIAFHGVDGEYLQSQTNGPNSFNNSQNQLYGSAYNDAPVVVSDVHNAAMASSWADGSADAAPATAGAANSNQTTQVPVAVNVSANLGAALNGTETAAGAIGGRNGQALSSDAGNLGMAGAGNDADAGAAALGLGMADALSDTVSNGGSGGGEGYGGPSWASGGDAGAGTGVTTLAGTGMIDQDATAANSQGAQGGNPVGGSQDAGAWAQASSDTAATLGQQSNAGPSDAVADNANGQNANAEATSVAQNTTAATTDDTTSAVVVDQVIAVKSVVVYDQGCNSGVINNGAQGAISQQQINALPINSTAFVGPVNMGNALSINALYN